MKFAITSHQRKYFYQEQRLELEEVLTDAQIEILSKGIDSAMLKKKNSASGKAFMLGYDLWRADPAIAKVITNPKWAEIAAELTRSRILRLGFDQWFPPHSIDTDPTYEELLSKPESLRRITCIQGVCCGLLLCLSDYPGFSEEPYEGVFPKFKGHGVFIAPEKTIDFPTLRQRYDQQFLLIVYTEKTAIYTMQPRDPHTHEFKKLGYVFGDKLNDSLHPIIYR